MNPTTSDPAVWLMQMRTYLEEMQAYWRYLTDHGQMIVAFGLTELDCLTLECLIGGKSGWVR